MQLQSYAAPWEQLTQRHQGDQLLQQLGALGLHQRLRRRATQHQQQQRPQAQALLCQRRQLRGNPGRL